MMPTNRTRTPRAIKPKVTPEVLALWRKLRRMKSNRIRADDRVEWLKAEKELCSLLGLGWGDAGLPTSVDGPEPPIYMRHNPYQAAGWREAWQWRCALEEADNADKSQAY
jgi:hypothetical protein